MTEGQYTGGTTAAGRWGCIAAAFLGVPIFLILLVADAIGDCVPGTTCQKGFVTQVLLPSAAIAICVGLLVRWAVKTAKDNSPD